MRIYIREYRQWEGVEKLIFSRGSSRSPHSPNLINMFLSLRYIGRRGCIRSISMQEQYHCLVLAEKQKDIST